MAEGNGIHLLVKREKQKHKLLAALQADHELTKNLYQDQDRRSLWRWWYLFLAGNGASSHVEYKDYGFVIFIVIESRSKLVHSTMLTLKQKYLLN